MSEKLSKFAAGAVGSQVMYRTKAVASELPWGMSVVSGSRL